MAQSQPGKGLSQHMNWHAEMIRPLSDGGVETPASFVRKRVSLDAVAGNETLRISAQGLYICFINGRRVGNDLLTPGWTSYDARLAYQTYPVADLLAAGENTVEIWLADGWYRSQMMWAKHPIWNCWGDKIAALAQIESAGKIILATDATWTSGLLPVRKSGIYFGETFDARVALEETHGVEAIAFDKSILVAHETTPVRELEALPVTRQWQDEEGRTLVDFGQNSAGYVALTLTGPAGSRVLVEHAEILDKNGVFNNANLRTAKAQLDYTLSGEGEEHYRPLFSFQGFRYARLTLEGGAQLKAIESIPISSVHEPKATFESGNPLVDRLVLNTLWSQRANFIEVPTDCPQRDERLGWTGDAQVFASTACYLHNSHAFWRKWLRDVMVDQRPDGAIPHVSPDPTRLHEDKIAGFYGSTGWGDAICVVPWTLYLHYGDKDVLSETLPAMEKWVDFVWSISNGPIVRPPRLRKNRGATFGDWLQPGGPSEKPLPTIGDDAAATIYLFIASTLTARAARTIGNAAVAERMEQRADAVKAAFRAEFVTQKGRLVYDDQTSYALALLYDLLPPEQVATAAAYFRDTIERAEGKIGTGFIGTPALLPALVKIGAYDLAEAVFLQEEVPGWLYQVKIGATTIWERWDAIRADGGVFDAAMNSYNHYAYGAVCQWLFEAAAGFRPDPENPGFKSIIFEPVILPRLGRVSAHHDAAVGRISAAWQLDGDKVTYRIAIPEGSRGRLVLADHYGAPRLDGEPTGSVADLAPGDHTVEFSYSPVKNTAETTGHLA